MLSSVGSIDGIIVDGKFVLLSDGAWLERVGFNVEVSEGFDVGCCD